MQAALTHGYGSREHAQCVNLKPGHQDGAKAEEWMMLPTWFNIRGYFTSQATIVPVAN